MSWKLEKEYVLGILVALVSSLHVTKGRVKSKAARTISNGPAVMGASDLVYGG